MMDWFSGHWLVHYPLSTVSIYFAFVIVLASILYHIFQMKGLPPGPVGLPLLGYWPFLNETTCHLQLVQQQKKYGDIFSFNYAGALYINMGSVKAIREFHLAKADCFERTYDNILLNEVFHDGVAFCNGESWKAQRKFVLQQFKDLGMTTMKDNMSIPVHDTVQETIEYLRSKNGEPVEILTLITDKCNTVMRRTLFGDGGITGKEISEIYESYGEVMTFMSVMNMMHAGNIARYIILPLQPGFQRAKKHHWNMEKIISEVIKRHKETLDESQPRDFIDAYYKEKYERQSRGDSTAELFTDKALIGNLVQFVGDGVLGVASFVALFLKYVVEHEEEQEKIYSELMEVVGQDRSPTIDDKSKLSYTNAFILETLRVSDFFPLFPSQQCIKETTVRGYRIPKGAITLMNTWGCHMDPEVYENPETFNPSRFIPKEGQQRPELPVTFGIGRRNCLGEGFTMMQVFLFLTTIVKNFKLSFAKKTETTTFELLMSGKMEIHAQPRD